MGEQTPTAADAIDNETRRAVFFTLVSEASPMTPSDIANAIDDNRQKVAYHLDSLVNMGLVISDGGEYYCQPLFIDPSFNDEVEDILSSLTPEVEKRMFLGDTDTTPERASKILNCIRLSFTMSLFPEDFDRNN